MKGHSLQLGGSENNIVLIPRDGLFCKDGRGWHSSASGHGHGLDWPWPSTLRGALLTAWGRQDEQHSAILKTKKDWLEHKTNNDVALGATLALRRAHTEPSWRTADRVWPAPADTLWLEGHANVWRLDPQQTDGQTIGRDDAPAREALWWPVTPDQSKPLAAPRWLAEEDFISWLCGNDICARSYDEYPAQARHIQAHVGIDPQTRTAQESILFSHDVLEMMEEKHQWAIAAQAILKSGSLPDLVTLGSDSRLARLEYLDEGLFGIPEVLANSFTKDSSGLRLVVVNPTSFDNGWLPDGFEVCGTAYSGNLPGIDGEVILQAAFVQRPLHVSGWDIAKGAAKQTDNMVPPGSTYFFRKSDGQPFNKSEAQNLWLAAMGNRTEEGFGRVVPGVWSAEEKKND